MAIYSQHAHWYGDSICDWSGSDVDQHDLRGSSLAYCGECDQVVRVEKAKECLEFAGLDGHGYRAFYDAREDCWHVDQASRGGWVPLWFFVAENGQPGLVFGAAVAF